MRLMTALLTSCLILAACDSTDPSDPVATETPHAAPAGSMPSAPPPDIDAPVAPPPPGWLETPDGAQWMAYWTFCWNEGCVDMIPPEQMPDVPQVQVSEGDEVTFHLGFDPTQVELLFPDRDDSVSLPTEREVAWTVSEFGFVVLMARPAGGGDASYLVELVAPFTDPTGTGEDAVNVLRGAEHCGWDSVRVISVSAAVAPPRTEGDLWVDFVRDIDGVLPDRLVFDDYDADATLPDDASATGHETPYGDLWLTPSEPDAAYLVNDSGTERWPAADPGCD